MRSLMTLTLSLALAGAAAADEVKGTSRIDAVTVYPSGAEIVREPQDTEYGSREYGAKDPEGNAWYFGTYQPFVYGDEAREAQAATTA